MIRQYDFDDILDEVDETEPVTGTTMQTMLSEALGGPIDTGGAAYASPRRGVTYASEREGLVSAGELLHIMAGKKLNENVIFEQYDRAIQDFTFLVSTSTREGPEAKRKSSTPSSFRPGAYRVVGSMHCGSDPAYFLVPADNREPSSVLDRPFVFACDLWVDQGQVEQFIKETSAGLHAGEAGSTVSRMRK